MRVLVCGGRDYNDKTTVFNLLDKLHSETPIISVVHGCARGADSLAAEWAKLNGVPEERYPAQWGLYGKAAGYKRNTQMAETSPDLVVALPGGRGTAMMLDIAIKKGLTVMDLRKDPTNDQ